MTDDTFEAMPLTSFAVVEVESNPAICALRLKSGPEVRSYILAPMHLDRLAAECTKMAEKLRKAAN